MSDTQILFYINYAVHEHKTKELGEGRPLSFNLSELDTKTGLYLLCPLLLTASGHSSSKTHKVQGVTAVDSYEANTSAAPHHL